MASQASAATSANSRLAQMQRVHGQQLQQKQQQQQQQQQLQQQQQPLLPYQKQKSHLAVPLKLNESWAGRRLYEALSHLPPNKFGSSLNMRFQQKQQQEREQRRIEMTTTTTTAATTPTGSTGSTLAEDIGDVVGQKAMGNGKVRQMFDERRRGVGIDRSHPLKPIASMSNTSAAAAAAAAASSSVRSTKSTTMLMTSTRAAAPAATGGRKPVARRTVNATRSTLSRSSNQSYNGNHSELDNGNFPKQFSSMSLNDHEFIGDRNNNNSRSNGMSRETSSNGIKLNPVVTKKSPVMAAATTTAASTVRTTRQATPIVHNAGARQPLGVRNSPATPPRNLAGTVKSPPKSVDEMSGNVPRQPQQPPQVGMSTCRYCGRHFNEERLAKHEHVCQKMMNSKRKIFDASKHRVKGTDAEKYQPRKLGTRSGGRAGITSSASFPTTTGGAVTGSSKKNNWRQKHEEFIAAIRAAKQVQAHIARGGKLSDLPPPPPSENPDYIQCPHCLRRFNEAAAERHIPKCVNMLHNKPKPGQQPKRR